MPRRAGCGAPAVAPVAVLLAAGLVPAAQAAAASAAAVAASAAAVAAGRAVGRRSSSPLYHTWHFTDRRDDRGRRPVLDLLNGDAIGVARAVSRATRSRCRRAIPTMASASACRAITAGATQVHGGTVRRARSARSTSAAWPPRTCASSPISDSGSTWSASIPGCAARGSTFSIDNLANTRQRVTDATGTVPINYQPELRQSARADGPAVRQEAVLLGGQSHPRRQPARRLLGRAACRRRGRPGSWPARIASTGMRADQRRRARRGSARRCARAGATSRIAS